MKFSEGAADHRRSDAFAAAAWILPAVLGLPLAGALLAGRGWREFTEFPPRLEIPAGYISFSWTAAGAVIALLAAIAGSWVASRRRGPPTPGKTSTAAARRVFPAWGWGAVAWTLVWWTLAWTRFAWFAPWQPYTFFPLWLGFIVSVNAATDRAGGTCLLRRAPGRWVALFGASAFFWWVFEWLNRFVRNWHYLGVEDFGPAAYALHATVCFSTVLPAVAGVAEWLATHGAWRQRTATGPRWAWLGSRTSAVALLGVGVAGLVGTGWRPMLFYPALWVAPLVLWLGAERFAGRPGLTRELARGDWRRAATWMAATLVCGFFWELWNWQSLARWIYTVPGVQRWHVFEMPLLGYAGYLPFGLECLLLAERLLPEWRAPDDGA